MHPRDHSCLPRGVQQQPGGTDILADAHFYAAAEHVIAHCWTIDIVAHNSTNVVLPHKTTHRNTHGSANGVPDANSNAGSEQDANNATPYCGAADPNGAQCCRILQCERPVRVLPRTLWNMRP